MPLGVRVTVVEEEAFAKCMLIVKIIPEIEAFSGCPFADSQDRVTDRRVNAVPAAIGAVGIQQGGPRGRAFTRREQATGQAMMCRREGRVHGKQFVKQAAPVCRSPGSRRLARLS